MANITEEGRVGSIEMVDGNVTGLEEAVAKALSFLRGSIAGEVPRMVMVKNGPLCGTDDFRQRVYDQIDRVKEHLNISTPGGETTPSGPAMLHVSWREQRYIHSPDHTAMETNT